MSICWSGLTYFCGMNQTNLTLVEIPCLWKRSIITIIPGQRQTPKQNLKWLEPLLGVNVLFLIGVPTRNKHKTLGHDVQRVASSDLSPHHNYPSEAHRSTPNDINPKQKHNQPTVTNKEFHTSSNYDEIPIWVPFHIVDISLLGFLIFCHLAEIWSICKQGKPNALELP